MMQTQEEYIDYARKTIKELSEQNQRLLEIIYNMKKDGFTYDPLTHRKIVCDKCGEAVKFKIEDE